MGLMDFFKKQKEKYIFVVNKEILRQFILEQIELAKEERLIIAGLEYVEEIRLYENGTKKTIDITRNPATNEVFYGYNGLSYTDMDAFFENVIDPLPGEYFKIELNWSNSKILNDFKNAHPELKLENY